MGVCNSQNKNDNEEVVPNSSISQSKKKEPKINNKEDLNETFNQPIIKSNLLKNGKKKISNSENMNIKSNKLLVTIVNNNNSNIYIINFEASIGEKELPIFVKEDEKIEITIKNSEEKTWSFINEELTNYNGYTNYKYNEYNLGCLFCRISSSQTLHQINSNKYNFISESPGTILLSCNLDLNDIPNYQLKGSIKLEIKGGKIMNFDEISKLCHYKLKGLYNDNNENDEEKIFRYINMARIEPLQFSKDFLYFVDENEDIIKIMKDYSSLPELSSNIALKNAAKKHNNDLCMNGTTGHIGTDKSNVKDRIYKFDKNFDYFGENIYFGINNPLFIVINMLIDKYGHEKQNRNNILDERFQEVGISLGEHLIYGYSCVIVFGSKKL
jgi:hypothetical protein